MIKTFNIGVKALIVNDNKVLVLKELDKRRENVELYDLPGGRMEVGESPEETLKRELKEELGISKFKFGSVMDAQIHPYYDNDGSALLLLFYYVDVVNPKIKLSQEHISFRWISKTDLEQIIKNKERIHKAYKTALEKVLK